MNFKRTILKGGLRVVTVPIKDAPTVTVLVMVETGSKYEAKKVNGLSHFLEHMCFKGTEKRPTALVISKELDSLGSEYNAFTSEEYTGYYAKSSAKHTDKILDIVSDIYLNSVFPTEEIEREKGVIIEEINMYHDLPQRHVQKLFMELLYGDQPAGRTILGPKENILAMKRDNFMQYRKQHYVASATTVIVAGNINEKKILSDIKNKFKLMSKGKKEGKVKTRDTQKKPGVLIERRPTDQTHLILGVRAYPVGNKNIPSSRILNGVLGAGMSSRLFQKLREEMGVGYYVRSSYDSYTDHGILSVSIGCDIKRVHEVIAAIVAELKKFKTTLVSEEELNKTKEYLIGTMYLGLESSDDLAEFYGAQEILNQKLKTPSEIVKEIRAITAKDIQAVAKKLFVKEHLNLAAIGPLKADKKISDLLTFS